MTVPQSHSPEDGPRRDAGKHQRRGPTNPKEGTSMVTDDRPETKPKSRTHLTIAELCAELDIARSTFYDWRQARKAPRCIKLPNGDIRVRRRDLEAWLETLEDVA